MPTLRRFFVVYTDGAELARSSVPPGGLEVAVREFSPLVLPGPHDELYGPDAGALARLQPRRAFLLAFRREVSGPAGRFFDETRQVLLEAVRGLAGVGLDVLRLWPFSLALAEERLPDEHLAEDLFSVAFTSMGEHGTRVETVGLAQLDQPELTFTFHGPELQEEAALMCGHLVDWLLEHGRRLGPHDTLAFGFDRLDFRPGGAPVGPRLARAWHHPLITRLLGEAEFPGVGVLEIRTGAGHEPAQPDLTQTLRRSLEQRLLLEEYDLTGDAPHASATAVVQGSLQGLSELDAWREEPAEFRDSGWRFVVRGAPLDERLAVTLAELARRAPGVVRCLALPWGIHLAWDGHGQLAVDASRVRFDPGVEEEEG